MPDAKEVLEHLEKKPKFKPWDQVRSKKWGQGYVIAVEYRFRYPVIVIWDNCSYGVENYAIDGSRSSSDSTDSIIMVAEAKGVGASNPSHYRVEGIPEAIDIMRGLMTEEQLEGFLWGNIIKYAYRYGRKGDTQGEKTETAAKIKWYADAMIVYLRGH